MPLVKLPGRDYGVLLADCGEILLGGFLLFLRGVFACRHAARDIRENFLESFPCRDFLFSTLIMTVFVLAVAGPAHYLHNLFTNHGNYGVIGG